MRPLTALVVLLVGTALAYAGVGDRRWEVPGAALAAVGVTAWLLTNSPYEGAVLLSVAAGNGLTVADLLAGPAVVLLLQLAWRGVRR